MTLPAVPSSLAHPPSASLRRAASDDQLLERAVVILGAPRSGTSMLGRLLARHPDVAYLVEPRLTWKWGNDAKSDVLRPADARPEVRAHLRRAFASAVRAAGRQRLLEKHPSNSLRMGFVDAVLPGCVFVHILRDGIESALSIRRFWQQHARGIPRRRLADRWRELSWRQAPHYVREAIRRVAPRSLQGVVGRPVWGPRLPGIEQMAQELDPLEIACLQWRTCVELACAYGRALPAERYLEIRLEDMSPETVARILDFARLPPSPEVLAGYAEEFDPSRTQYHRSAAATADEAICRAWLQPALEWLGYGG
jgi:LPS sulfotransferase NodH